MSRVQQNCEHTHSNAIPGLYIAICGKPNVLQVPKNEMLGTSWPLEFGEVLTDKQLTGYPNFQLATKNMDPGASVAREHFAQHRAMRWIFFMM